MPGRKYRFPHLRTVWVKARSGARVLYAYYRHVPAGQKELRIGITVDDVEVFPQSIDSVEFARAYVETEKRAEDLWKEVEGRGDGELVVRERKGSIAALITEYKASADWLTKSANTHRSYKPHLDWMRENWGEYDAARLKRRNILVRRDQLLDTPRTADLFVQVVSKLMSFAINRDYRLDNPALKIDKVNKANPYEAWTDEEIALFRKTAPPHVRILFLTLLYTGQRESDVVRMSRATLQLGYVEINQQKTGKPTKVKLHEGLKRELKRHKVESVEHLLVNSRGQPWTADGARTALYDVREAAGLLHVVPHGLRKNALVYLFEAGATTVQAASVTNQSLQMVEHYWNRWRQAKLAEQAISLWEENERRTKKAARGDKNAGRR